ncbi:MAG: hypothetical protein AAGI22_01025 [Planctomycetota bacterium]
MVAFRFLALLTVGFVLLSLIFLLSASHGRLEREQFRVLTGPTFSTEQGTKAEWVIELGGPRIDQAWPAAQRQPRLFVRGVPGARIAARARYIDKDGGTLLPALEGTEPVVGAVGETDGVLEFGPLWMSWDHPLEITFEVLEAGPEAAMAEPVLRGAASTNYVAARAIARTLWFVFAILGALGLAGLVASDRELFARRPEERPSGGASA